MKLKKLLHFIVTGESNMDRLNLCRPLFFIIIIIISNVENAIIMRVACMNLKKEVKIIVTFFSLTRWSVRFCEKKK